MAITSGLPSPADLLLLLDSLGSILKAQYANLGRANPSETTTLAALAALGRDKVLGDGTSTYPGLTNAPLRAQVRQEITDLAQRCRWDTLLKLGQSLTYVDSAISTNLPSGWLWASSDSRRALDLWLTYLNANDPSTPAAPSAPTLTAATGGALATCLVGAAPRVKVCYQSASGDWLVSQPSAAAAQVALAGPNNAYTFTLGGNVPAGMAYLIVFRQLAGAGANDPYYYDQRVAVTPGAAHPAVTIKQADADLRRDLCPPSWLQCLLMPEDAALVALTFASQAMNNGSYGALTFASQAFVSPYNVTMNPANAFLGVNNPVSGAEFARWASTVFAAGTPNTANDAANAIQGYGGAAVDAAAGGLRLRVAGVLDAGASITNLTYTYLDAAHPVTPQAGTAAGPFALAAPEGSTVVIKDADIPAGRLVRTVTGMTVGTATTGTIVVEANPLRAL